MDDARAQSQVFPGTAVSIGGRAVLISGPSGIGKSELALLLIDRGGTLISDDHVALTRRDGKLFGAPAPNLAGLIEVRNIGLQTVPYCENVMIALSILLDRSAPRWVDCSYDRAIGGISVPEIRIDPDSRVLAIKAEMALRTYGLSV